MDHPPGASCQNVMLIPKGIRAGDSVQAHLQRFLESGQIAESVKVHEDD